MDHIDEATPVPKSGDAMIVLLQAQQQHLHRISNHMMKLEATVGKIDTRLAVIEARDYNADIKDMKTHLDKIQAYIDGQTGVANFFSWIGKNLVWMAMLVVGVFAYFGITKGDTTP